MLNPKLYEDYDASVVDAFKDLIAKAENDGEHVALSGVRKAYGVKAPKAVYTKSNNYITIDDVLRVFHTYAPKATPEDMDMFGSLLLLDGESFWKNRKKSLVELWV